MSMSELTLSSPKRSTGNLALSGSNATFYSLYACCLEPLALLLDNLVGLLLTAYYFSFFGVFFQIKR
jgi:hypothetical protein